MSNLLFLTSQYTGAAGANGICTRNIVNALKMKGHRVSVVCYDTGDTEDDVYTIPVTTKVKRNLGQKVAAAIGSFISTSLDKDIEQYFQNLTLTLCEKKKIDTVICVFFPLEAAPVVRAVKKQLPHIATVIYELDSVGDGIFSKSKCYYFAKRAYERWGADNYRYADKVIIMKSHEEYWRKVWGKEFEEKLLIADIPVLMEHTFPRLEKREDSPTSIVYSGLLNRKYRSPKHLLSVFDVYSKNANAVLDFFSKGDCEELILSFRKNNPCIRQLGYVPSAVLEEAIVKADVLVSIGNKVSRSVPSKLITYLSYGKPVIHFATQKDDISAKYLDNYPLGLVLREWDSVEENAYKLHAFIEQTRGKYVDFSSVTDILRLNVPSFSANLIEGVIANS